MKIDEWDETDFSKLYAAAKEALIKARPPRKPCPFCGSRNIEKWCGDPYDGYQGPGTGYYQITCCDCGASIIRTFPDQAEAAWDRRAEGGK